MNINPPSRRSLIRITGFTLVEMLVAMAVTLLIMASVAKAFAFVGQRVRESRSNLNLSSELRDVTTRMSEEFERCTVTLQPNQGGPDQAGYFLYAEGPCTDATTSIFGATSLVDGQGVASESRWGDLDDYLAFTAVAAPGTWFSGIVPQSVLSGVAADTNSVVIRSRYAEIVYFPSPERDAGGVVIDGDADGIPDRLLLHRRVLLIRPDLNLSATGGLRNLFGGTDWQTGLAGVHQICDLSIRRVLSAAGLPTIEVAANSLADLSLPHNRFAHVRVPSSVLSVGIAGTSMPILALTEPLAMISGSTPPLRPVDKGGSNANVVLETQYGGFLHPNFVLTGVNGERAGQDVVANNCRGFDLQVFDPTATLYLTSNDLVVGPSDVGYREAIFDAAATPVQGGFVDLCYPVLAGGPLRGWQARNVAVTANAGNPGNASVPDGAANLVNLTRMQSEFSGLDFTATSPNFPGNIGQATYTPSLLRSGRMLINNSQIVLFQPAFDTFTSGYEHDGFLQNRRYLNTGAGRFQGSYWQATASVTNPNPNLIDLATDGLDNRLTILPSTSGVDDLDEQETTAPFLEKPSAIRVSVRLENSNSRLLRQSTITLQDAQP